MGGSPVWHRPTPQREEPVEHPSYFQLMLHLRELIDAEFGVTAALDGVAREPAALGLSDEEWNIVGESVVTLVELHKEGWNGIWCSILAEGLST